MRIVDDNSRDHGNTGTEKQPSVRLKCGGGKFKTMMAHCFQNVVVKPLIFLLSAYAIGLLKQVTS